MLGAHGLGAGVGVDPAGLAVDHRRVAVHDLDLVALQQRGDAAGQAADDAVLPVDRAREVERRPLDREAERRLAVGLLGALVERVGGMDDRLRRDAADIEAGAAQPPSRRLLDQHDVEAELAGADGGDIAAGAAADDQHLGVDLGHLTPP